jgi:hypothetical protein
MWPVWVGYMEFTGNGEKCVQHFGENRGRKQNNIKMALKWFIFEGVD